MAGRGSLGLLVSQLARELRDIRIAMNVMCALIEARGGLVSRAELGRVLEGVHDSTPPAEQGHWLPQLARDLQLGKADLSGGDGHHGRPQWLRGVIERRSDDTGATK